MGKSVSAKKVQVWEHDPFCDTEELSQIGLKKKKKPNL